MKHGDVTGPIGFIQSAGVLSGNYTPTSWKLSDSDFLTTRRPCRLLVKLPIDSFRASRSSRIFVLIEAAARTDIDTPGHFRFLVSLLSFLPFPEPCRPSLSRLLFPLSRSPSLQVPTAPLFSASKRARARVIEKLQCFVRRGQEGPLYGARIGRKTRSKLQERLQRVTKRHFAGHLRAESGTR